jgi:phosphonatase-like hydrolase
MTQTIKLVVFDMAGTTVNEGNVVYKTVKKSLNDAGYPITISDVLTHGAGKEKHQAITDILKNCTGLQDITPVADTVFANFKAELEKAYSNLDVTTFEGTEQLFKDLRKKDIKVVLNTGYDAKTANGLLQKLAWKVGETIDALVTADDVQNGRPAGDMIFKAMEIVGIKDSKLVLKVGDSKIDIEEGFNANCGMTAGVLTGAQTREEIQKANPTYILDSLTELRAILL